MSFSCAHETRTLNPQDSLTSLPLSLPPTAPLVMCSVEAALWAFDENLEKGLDFSGHSSSSGTEIAHIVLSHWLILNKFKLFWTAI